jgi:PIN domain nuclease of toxin-antitoxin system
MKVLLDTCTFLWLSSDPEQLSKTAKDVLASSENQTFLSTASVWETAIKYNSGKLYLTERPDILIPRTRAESFIDSLDIDEESALLAGRLARHHSDPFDSMLVAQAIVHGMTLLSPDSRIAEYAVRVLW